MLIATSGQLKERLKQMIHEYHVENCVQLLGQNDDMAELYSASDVFLLPSLYEGLAIAALEARHCGLPCIMSADVPKDADAMNDDLFILLDD